MYGAMKCRESGLIATLTVCISAVGSSRLYDYMRRIRYLSSYLDDAKDYLILTSSYIMRPNGFVLQN